MVDFKTLIQTFLIISFLLYGASCFLSQHILQEFERYQLSRLRKVTGALQLLACAGLFLGFYYSIFTTLASLLLSAMMLVALAVRIRLRDSLLMTAPAVLYFVLSMVLLFSSF